MQEVQAQDAIARPVEPDTQGFVPAPPPTAPMPQQKYKGARNGDESDILPFYAVKQYARMLKGHPKYGHLWNVHDPKWWAKKMAEAEEKLKKQQEEEAIGLRRFAFKNCEGVYYNSTKYYETVFEGEKKVPAMAQDTEDYRKTASELGYGENLDLMCLHHEVAHTVLAEANGKPYSPTLWAVANNQEGDVATLDEQYEEESIVLAFQKWYMTGEGDDKLRGLNLEKLGETFASVVKELRV